MTSELVETNHVIYGDTTIQHTKKIIYFGRNKATPIVEYNVITEKIYKIYLDLTIEYNKLLFTNVLNIYGLSIPLSKSKKRHLRKKNNDYYKNVFDTLYDIFPKVLTNLIFEYNTTDYFIKDSS